MSESAIARCSWSRRRLGRLAYATSRRVSCRSRQRCAEPSPPASSCTRISASSKAMRPPRSHSGTTSRASARSNDSPKTARRRASSRESSGRASNREATTACTVGGSPFVASPDKSAPVDSTMKKGLPPARVARVRASEPSTRPPLAWRTSASASSEASGSRCSITWFTARVPQPGRWFSSSGRAVASTSVRPRPWRVREASRSMRSSMGARSACTSSSTSTTGARAASRSTSEMTPACTSCTYGDSSRPGGINPRRRARRSTVRWVSSPSCGSPLSTVPSRSTSSRRRCIAFSGGSSWSIPATSRTIHAAGAKVVLSVVRLLRPVSTVVCSATPATNSSARRDLPMPDSPKTVTSSGRPVETTRA